MYSSAANSPPPEGISFRKPVGVGLPGLGDDGREQLALGYADAPGPAGQRRQDGGGTGEGNHDGIGRPVCVGLHGVKLPRGMEKNLPLPKRITFLSGGDGHFPPIGVDEFPKGMAFSLKTVSGVIFEIVNGIQLLHDDFPCDGRWRVTHGAPPRMRKKGNYMRGLCNDRITHSG